MFLRIDKDLGHILVVLLAYLGHIFDGLVGQCFPHKSGVLLATRYEGTKSFALSSKKIVFWPENGQIRPKICIFGHFWHFLLCSTKNNENEVPRWFSDMWVPKLLLPPKIIRIYGPKTTIFAPKYAFLGTYRPCRLIWCPLGWLVGGCGAWVVSRRTCIYFITFDFVHPAG